MWSTLTSILHYTGGWILFGKIYRFKVDYVMVNACKTNAKFKEIFLDTYIGLFRLSSQIH